MVFHMLLNSIVARVPLSGKNNEMRQSHKQFQQDNKDVDLIHIHSKQAQILADIERGVELKLATSSCMI